MKARLLSVLLVLCLLLSLIPCSGLADSIDIDLDEIVPSGIEASDAGEKAPAEDEAFEKSAPEKAAPELKLRELAEVYAGDALTVDYLYTGEGELTITWQALAGEDEWVELETPFKAEEGVSYRCIVTDGDLTAISDVTTALPAPAVEEPAQEADVSVEEADTPEDILEAEETASVIKADNDKTLSGTSSWITLPFKTMSVGDRLYINLDGEDSCEIIYNDKYIVQKSDGCFYAKKKGSTTVKFVSYETGATKSFKLTIKAKPSSLTISNSSLNCGEWARIKVKGNTGGSTYAESIEIGSGTTCGYECDDDGYIKPTSAGKLCLYAKNCSGKKSKLKTFTVKAAPAKDNMGFKLQHEFGSTSYYDTTWGYGWTLRVAKGDYAKIKPVFESGYGGTYTVFSDDTSVLKYSSGKVSFVGTGEANIVFRAYNGVEIKMPFTVNPSPKTTSSIYNEAVHNIAYLNYVQFSPYSLLSEATGYSYNYVHMKFTTSAKKYIKTSASYGSASYLRYTGVKKGSATITLKLFNGKKYSRKIKTYANKVSSINSKPTYSQIRDNYYEYGKHVYDVLSSIEVVGKHKIKVTFYLANAYPRAITSVSGLRPWIKIYEDDVTTTYQVSSTFTKKIKIGAYAAKAYSYTFTTPDIDWSQYDFVNGPWPGVATGAGGTPASD